MLRSMPCQHGKMVVHISVFMSLFPMVLAWLAWRFQRNLSPPLLGIRRQLFYCGLSANALCAVTCALVWLVSFPTAVSGVLGLVRLYSLLLAISLALFGRGIARLLLLGSALLLVIAVYWAFLAATGRVV